MSRDDDDEDADTDRSRLLESETARHRRLSESEVDDIARAQRRAQDSAERAKVLHKLELRLVELIGIEGEGGEFANLRRENDKHEERLNMLERQMQETTLFRHQIKWTVGIAAGIATMVGAVVLVVIEHFLK